MKKIAVLLVVFLTLVSSTVMAGEIKVNIDEKNPARKVEIKKEVEAQVEDVEVNVDFGGFKGNGGPVVGVIRLKVDELNDILKDNNFASMKEDMVMKGGAGLIGFKKGVRLGGYGLEGKLTSYNSETNRTARLKIAYGGFYYEQGIYAAPKTDLALGASIGGGSCELDLVYKDTESNFNDVISSPMNTSLSKEFVYFEPRINLHQQLIPLVGLDLGLGYMVTYDFGKQWKVEGEEISGGPFESLYAPTLNLRLSFGF